MREANSAAVETLDAALASAIPGATVLHAIDPQRVLSFREGGPPLWSVAVASAGGVHQFLSYGLSRAVDSASPFSFELALRVASQESTPPLWPTLLLRHIARYHLTSGREVRPGQCLPLGGPITRAPLAREHQASMPDTRMNTIFIVGGPTLPTPSGPVEFRTVFALDSEEQKLLELGRASTFARILSEVNPSLTVSLDAPSLVQDTRFMQAARTEGSDCTAMVVPQLRWEDDGSAVHVRIPKGIGTHLKARIASRLPFGQGLLLHAETPAPYSEVLLLPGDALDMPEQDQTRIVLQMPPQSSHFTFLSDADAAVWTFHYG